MFVRRRYLTEPRIRIAVAGLLMLLCFVRLDTATKISAVPRHLVATVSNPLSQPLHSLSAWTRSTPAEAEDLAERRELARINDELNQYNRQLEEQLRVARQRIAELSRIREVGGLEAPSLVPAGVTSWQGGAAPVLTINRGSMHGLAPGMVVGTAADLVGRISDVGPSSATVSLITAPRTLLDVRVLPPLVGPSGREVILQLQPFEGQELFWAEAAHTDPIQVGDLAHLRLADNVLASAARWPDEAAGMVVGKVVRIEDHPDDPRLRTRVIVQPRVSLRGLTRVVVLFVEQHD